MGFALFVYGKKQGRIPQLAVGLVMMVYPYFVPGPTWMLAIGGLLVGVLWLLVRMGY